MSLSDHQIRNFKAETKPYRKSDGKGLFLEVRPNGSKLWRVAYRFEGKQKLMALGAYPSVSLAAAREKQSEARALLAKGTDPMARKKEAQMGAEPLVKDAHDSAVETLPEAHSGSDLKGKTAARLGRPPSDKILERLTTAGLKIIEDEDVSGLTIERVCKVAKVSRATFYRRWKSINPVFMAMVSRILSDATPPVIKGNNLREIFERSMTNRAELLADKRVGALFRYAFSLAGHDEEMRYLIQELDRERNARLFDLFYRGQKEGRIKPDIRLDYVAHQLFGPIWHRSLLLQLPADPEFIRAVLDAVIRDISMTE